MRAREEKSKHYFQDFDEDAAAAEAADLQLSSRPVNTQELLLMESDTRMLLQREKEIQGVVRSIEELNAVFQDLATMVAEQGTIVDRIDHNVANAHIRVEEGTEQLRKAERYTRKTRKMKLILILAALLFLLLLFLLIKAS